MGDDGAPSFWWQQTGRVERGRPAGPSHADVCIVGAGYTGLWTAYYLARAAPQWRIVVLEQRFAGYGASGRNGGWLTNSITGGRDRYVRSHGTDAAHRLQVALTATVDEVLRVAAAEGIDADVARGGELTVATNVAQWARVRAAAGGRLADAAQGAHLAVEHIQARLRLNRCGLGQGTPEQRDQFALAAGHAMPRELWGSPVGEGGARRG